MQCGKADPEWGAVTAKQSRLRGSLAVITASCLFVCDKCTGTWTTTTTCRGAEKEFRQYVKGWISMLWLICVSAISCAAWGEVAVCCSA